MSRGIVVNKEDLAFTRFQKICDHTPTPTKRILSLKEQEMFAKQNIKKQEEFDKRRMQEKEEEKERRLAFVPKRTY